MTDLFTRITNAVAANDGKAAMRISEELRFRGNYTYDQIVKLFHDCTDISEADYETLINTY